MAAGSKDSEKLRQLAMPRSTQEVVTGIEQRIRTAEQALRKLDREWESLPKEAVSDLTRKIAEISRWQVRRRSLIEVWELATNLVWSMNKVK